MKILDCTIRDGGYYNDWDFDDSVVDSYIEATNQLPFEFLEIGYRSKKLKGYLGKYFYCPVGLLKEFKEKSNKKLAIILNEKEVSIEDIDELLDPCVGIISLIRMAVDPKNFEKAIELAKKVKEKGFMVAFNVMYMSKWKEDASFLDLLPAAEPFIDIFYMVDSFGGVLPKDVEETTALIKSKTNVTLGFHGHNNLELGLVNSLTAHEAGVTYIDATITGMGRGAGNLKTELLLSFLNANEGLEIDFNALSGVTSVFSELQTKYNWGTSLAYMVSGANSLPQKEVMDWMTKRYYSLNSIIRALKNRSQGKTDNEELPKLDLSGYSSSSKDVIIVGGGPSVMDHKDAITHFMKDHPDMVIVHASSKYAEIFKNLSNMQLFCLMGNEGHRLEAAFGKKKLDKAKCVLPAYPREMGTYLPAIYSDDSYELDVELNVTSQTSMALEICKSIEPKNIFAVGFDGYSGNNISLKDKELFAENEKLFGKNKKEGRTVHSLTSTKYSTLEKGSVYANVYQK